MINTATQPRAQSADWLEEGRQIAERERALARRQDTLAWEMGDWAVRQCSGYGDMKQAAAALGVNLGTLKNRASVSRRVDASRRRDDLSWSHHAEVASLVPEDGDALLDEAADGGRPVEHLRTLVGERSAMHRAQV